MKKIKLIFSVSIVFISAIIYSGCSDDSINNMLLPSVPVDSSQFRYPFTDGSTWGYTRTTSVSDIKPDSIRHYFENYTFVRTGRITILHDTVINSVTVKIFLEEYNYDSLTIIVNRFYYLNTDTALIYYSQNQSGSSSGLIPFRHVNGNIENRELNNLSILKDNYSAAVTDSIVTALKYPLVTGREWDIYYVKAQDMIHKKYIGFENISVPSGTFSCMKLQNIISFPNNYDYYYYSKYGLMKRSRTFDDILYTTPENPEGIGTVDYITEIVVTSFNIPSE